MRRLTLLVPFVLVALLAGCGSSSSSSSSAAPTSSSAAAPSGSTAGGVTLTETEFKITPSSPTAGQGGQDHDHGEEQRQDHPRAGGRRHPRAWSRQARLRPAPPRRSRSTRARPASTPSSARSTGTGKLGMQGAMVVGSGASASGSSGSAAPVATTSTSGGGGGAAPAIDPAPAERQCPGGVPPCGPCRWRSSATRWRSRRSAGTCTGRSRA